MPTVAPDGHFRGLPLIAIPVDVQKCLRSFGRIVQYGSSAERIGEASESDDSTFLYTVSEADGRHVPLQISEVQEFLSSNLLAIQELMARPGISGGVSDFGWDIPTTSVGQCNRFPLPFISRCSEAGLEIEISVSLTGIPHDG